MHDIFLISIGKDPVGEPDPDNPKSKVIGPTAWGVLKMRDEIKELKPLAHAFQLAKLDAAWSDPKYSAIHGTKSGWHLRYNQPDMFMFAVDEGNGAYAVVFERDGGWVGAEQHYPMPFLNAQERYKHVGDAMVHALKVAEWKP